MKFDCIITNPPFQDSLRRGKTPHKLWAEFARAAMSTWLKDEGVLYQISPASFGSPSSAVLNLMKSRDTKFIELDASRFFSGVGSSIAYFEIRNSHSPNEETKISGPNGCGSVVLDPSVFYLPNDFCPLALSIHKKVVFERHEKLCVEWDYVSCHNILRHRSDSLGTSESDVHRYPVLHTNRQIWWSSVRQEWASALKVMWSRSGYTKPFFDHGKLGGTDMVYFVRVSSAKEGARLVKFLNSVLLQYIFRTARWSGFGNEKVFASLPNIDLDRDLTDDEVFDVFGLSEEEREYVKS